MERGGVRHEVHGGEARPSPWVVVFFWGYLLAQVAVPAVQLTRPGHAQFGWQMYSGLQTTAHLEVFTSDSTYAVSIDSLVLRQRADVDYGDRLWQELCRATGAERVRIYREVPSRDRAFSCDG